MSPTPRRVTLLILLAGVLAAMVFSLMRGSPAPPTVEAATPAKQIPPLRVATAAAPTAHAPVAATSDGAEGAALDAAWSQHEPGAAISEILQRWARSNPIAVLRALLAKPPGPLRTSAIMQLAALWAMQDPRGAAAAMLQLEAADERNRGLGQVIAAWSASDPLAAIDWLEQTAGENDSAPWQTAQAYGVWARTDAPAAAQHALTGGAGAESMKAVLVAWSRTHPADAYAFFTDDLVVPQQNETAASFLLAVAANEDSTIAEKLIDQVLAASSATEDLARLGKSLALVDVDLAIRLADRLPDGPAREKLRQAIESQLFPVESSLPDDAAEAEGDDVVSQDFSVARNSTAAATSIRQEAVQGETASKPAP